jgi:acyl phosphate:glycerol-3-phosphate acyltransferase
MNWNKFTEVAFLESAGIAYLLGSIPFSIWIGKWFYGIDVREHGSGNAGTTNVLRVFGFKAALPVLILDIAKGFMAVRMINFLESTPDIQSSTFIGMKITLGLLAVLGHIYPIFAGFRGGKGVATIFGVVLAMHWGGGLAGLSVFVALVWWKKYVSLGSMMGAFAFAAFAIVGEIMKYGSDEGRIAMFVFAALVPSILVITHRKNIQRLIKGTENKINFQSK